MSTLDTQAVILAGGLGTRLRPVVPALPKCLAPVAGVPFLTHLLDQLDAAGFQSVVLCTGYGSDAVHGLYGSRFRSLQLTYSRELEPLGTGGALRFARPLIRSDTALVLNGDSYCDIDLSLVLPAHKQYGAEVTMLVVSVSDTERFGRVRFDESHRIIGFDEKAGAHGVGWINAGVYAFSQSFLDELPLQTPLSLEREVIPNWIGRGAFAFPTSARFIDIGTPDSYQVAAQVLSTIS